MTEYADKGKSKSLAHNKDNLSGFQGNNVPGKVKKLKLAFMKKPKQVEDEFKKLMGLPMNS